MQAVNNGLLTEECAGRIKKRPAGRTQEALTQLAGSAESTPLVKYRVPTLPEIFPPGDSSPPLGCRGRRRENIYMFVRKI